MQGLGHQHYSLVYCEKAKVLPWIVFEEQWQKLADAAGSLVENEKRVKRSHPDHFLDLLSLLAEGDRPQGLDLSEEKIIEALGIKSRDLYWPAFTAKEHFQKTFRESAHILRTEYFKSSSAQNTGAGRHALIGNLEAKGLGRNMLSNQLDYSHSWGGQLPIDALKAVLADQIVMKRTRQAPLRTIAVFLYQEKYHDTTLALSFREADSYRICQFWDDVMNSELRRHGREHYTKVFGTLSAEGIVKKLIQQYVHAFSQGVLHRTPTTENLTIDGRWIDTESIDFTADQSAHAPYLHLFVPGEKLPAMSSLKDLWNHAGEVRLMGSWAHDLKVSALMSHQVVNNIFQLQGKLAWTELFIEALREHRLWTVEWSHLLTNYRCIRQENLVHESVESLKPTSPRELDFAGEYHCIGNFYDQYLKGNILYFSTDTMDMGQRTLRQLEKWNLAVTKNDLTLPGAFKNAQLISQFR